MQPLFESLLQEASKERFLTKNWDRFEAAGAGELQPLLTYVNSQAFENKAKEKGVNWQKLADDDIAFILKSFNDYNESGGSRSNRKAAKKADPVKVFTENDKGLKTVHEGENVTGADFCILDSMETDNWIFVVPLTWEACKYADSLNCGGQGAKWCIGYEKTQSYFNDYIIGEGDWFILAFSKNPNPPENEQKYMLAFKGGLDDAYGVAWTQEDDKTDLYDYDFYSENLDGDFEDAMVQAFFDAIMQRDAGDNIYKEAQYQCVAENPMITDYLAITNRRLKVYFEGKCTAVQGVDFDYVILSTLCNDDYLVMAPLSEEGIEALAKATGSKWLMTEQDAIKGWAEDCYVFVFILQKMTGKCLLVGVNPIKEPVVWDVKGRNVPEELRKFGFNSKQLWQKMKTGVLTGQVPRSIFTDIYSRYGNQLEDTNFFADAASRLPSYIERVDVNYGLTEFYSTKQLTEEEFMDILTMCFKMGYYIAWSVFDEQPWAMGGFKYTTDGVPIKLEPFDGFKGSKRRTITAYKAVIEGSTWIVVKIDGITGDGIETRRKVAEVFADFDLHTSPGYVLTCAFDNEYYTVKLWDD